MNRWEYYGSYWLLILMVTVSLFKIEKYADSYLYQAYLSVYVLLSPVILFILFKIFKTKKKKDTSNILRIYEKYYKNPVIIKPEDYVYNEWKYRPKYRLEKLLHNILYIACGLIVNISLLLSGNFWGNFHIEIYLILSIPVNILARDYYRGPWTLRHFKNELLGKWFKSNSRPELGLYRVSSNYLTSGISSFDRDLNNNAKLKFLLLNSNQAAVLENISDESDIPWAKKWITRHYFLIDPSLKAERNLLDELNKSFHTPHVKCCLLFVDKNIDPSWNECIDFFTKNEMVKYIKKTDIDSYTSIDQFIELNPELDEKLVSQSILDMRQSYLQIYTKLNRIPAYLYRFYKSSLISSSYIQSISQLFEFSDMIMRLYCYYFIFLKKESLKVRINIGQDLSDYISLATCISDEFISNNFCKDVLINLKHEHPFECIKEYIPKIAEQLGCEIEESDTITFKGLAILLTLLRNKTKAHGVLTDESVQWLYPLLIKVTLMLMHSLNLVSLRIVSMSSGKFEVGFEEKIYNIYPFGFSNDKNDFLLLHETTKKKLIYLNYETADYFKPAINQFDLESFNIK
jgi:hypothetical protein